MIVYLDSNVFIFAAISNDKRAIKSREFIKKVILKEIDGATSFLTIDEVIWKIWREIRDRNLAIDEGLRILQFDNLKLTNVDENIMIKSLNLMKRYSSLKPRDAIHLASALSLGISAIVSDDKDFNNIKEIKRIRLE